MRRTTFDQQHSDGHWSREQRETAGCAWPYSSTTTPRSASTHL
ncbi:hypothetical protein SNL152K_10273 [Streptomyces sp. NL15-2K]|nr:hypothetical protein SNL152K_10273 [Streptomyces sp. NL15-2K]